MPQIRLPLRLLPFPRPFPRFHSPPPPPPLPSYNISHTLPAYNCNRIPHFFPAVNSTLFQRCYTSTQTTCTPHNPFKVDRTSIQEPPPPTGKPPLRILFCGSDHFSATALNALVHEHKRDRAFIESIDVVCRPAKKTGRGLKTLKEVPLKTVADKLLLPVHELNTFTGWEPPHPSPDRLFNLIIAVSFGRKVPPRILNQLAYGGLNVHPSLLPSYRGAAPIYHALLNAAPYTGVTVQTLHPDLIDHGAILLQSEEIPLKKGTTYQDLHDRLAVLGAHMLVYTCRHRLFEPPLQILHPNYPPSEAPKIDSSYGNIRWHEMSADDVERVAGVLGTVWTRLGVRDDVDRRKRVMLSHITVYGSRETEHLRGRKLRRWIRMMRRKCLLKRPGSPANLVAKGDSEGQLPKGVQIVKDRKETEPGTWCYISPGPEDPEGALIVKCRSGWVSVKGVKVEGKTLRHGAEWARGYKANLREGEKQIFT